jgi:hypothetical protein
VPRVASLLTFDYDVSGQFSHAFIAGRARFAPSTFLDASIGDGTTGTIDTSEQPIHFTGDGEIAEVRMRRFGEGLDVAWMRDPRYAGDLGGRFQVDVRGTDRATLALTASGRLRRASMFHGTLSDADVSVSLTGSAGPEPHEGARPGIVWIALEANDVAHARELRAPGDRATVLRWSEHAALDLLRRYLGALPLPSGPSLV